MTAPFRLAPTNNSDGVGKLTQEVSTLTAVLLNDTSGLNHHGCKVAVEQIRQNCAKVGIKIVHSVPLSQDWKDRRHTAKILGSHAVIVNGEGTMHSSKARCVNLAACASFCRERDIKSFLINSVYQRNDDIVATQVRSFDLVFVRESASRRALAAQGIEARVVPDMVFAYELNQSLRENARNGLLFTDSMDSDITEVLYHTAATTPGASFLTVRANLFDKSLGQRFVSGVRRQLTAALKWRAPESWKTEARRFKKKELRLKKMARFYSPSVEDLLRAVASSEVVVTGRFHMACFALLTGTPLLAISGNTHKIEGMLEDVGLEGRLADVDQLGAIAGTHNRWRDNDLDRVDQYVCHAKKEIPRMFADIRAAMET